MINVNSHGRRLLSIVVVLLVITQPVLLLAQPATAAPSNGNNGDGGGTSAKDLATKMCNSTGYSLFLGIVYMLMGLSILSLATGGLVGAGLISVGWISRTISSIAKKMVTGSFVGGIILLFLLAFVGIVVANVSIGIPNECLWLFS
jgi:hypothetical protein